MMANETVKKRGKSGARFKTFKETRREAKKSRDALKRCATKKIAGIWGF
jgi:hypothetical protein